MEKMTQSEIGLAKSRVRFMAKELEEAQPDKLRGETGTLFRQDSIASFFERRLLFTLFFSQIIF